MEICISRNHEEIVYDSRHCPLCAAIQEIEQLKNDVAALEDAERNHECQTQ